MKYRIFILFTLLFTIFGYSGTLDIFEYISCKYDSDKEDYVSDCKTTTTNSTLDISIGDDNTLTWNQTKFKIQSSQLQGKCQDFFINRDNDTNIYIVAICLNDDKKIEYINFIQQYNYKISFELNLANNSSTDTNYYSGSGFGISNYYLITNYHVIKEMKAGIMIYKNAEAYSSATIKYADSSLDLVILKTDKPIKACKIDPSNQPISSEIYVYGYPKIQSMGISLKVTKGIISSKFGYQDDIEKYQIDAAVQPGNSGGPVIKNGKIIGITVSMLEESQNVNYAIKSVYLYAMLESTGIRNTGNDKPENCTYLIFGQDK